MDREAAIALLESQHQFPSDHLFRVIVRAEAVTIAAVSASLAAHRGLESLEGRIVHQPSSAGKYVSLRVSLPCASAADVLEVYAHLRGIEAVLQFF
jgi:putative lipoic acid-binding regulatory protein